MKGKRKAERWVEIRFGGRQSIIFNISNILRKASERGVKTMAEQSLIETSGL